MNRYQNIVVIVAAGTLLLMLLFPPFLDNPMALGAPKSFESFYFVFMAPAGTRIYNELLTVEIIFVLVNALTAWLVLNRGHGRDINVSDRAAAKGLLLFALVDFAVIGLFPPFQPYQSLVRALPDGFDGFYFAFGDKRHREIFLPLLYLELILVSIDLLVVWLLFGLLRRSISAVDAQLIAAVHHLPAREAEAIIEAIEAEAAHVPEHPVADQPPPEHHELGRGGDRRHHQDPDYHGPERRSGHDRRHLPE